MELLSILFLIAALGGCIAGGFQLVDTFVSAQSAPQQAAGAAMAAACAVIPYCWARIFREFVTSKNTKVSAEVN